MKTIPQIPSGGLARIATLVIAAFGLGAATALALPTVKLDISNQDFGNGNTISATSASSISPSGSFTYTLVGKVDGTGALAGAVIPGTSIETFIKSIVPKAKLSRVVPNPNAGGALSPAVVLLSETYTGTRDIPGFGTAEISLKILAEIQPSGKVTLDISEVSITKNGAPVAGTLKFRTGSVATVNTAAEIGFKSLNQSVDKDLDFIEVIVLRGKNGVGPVTVKYATSDGTALKDVDYAKTAGTLRFKQNQLKKTIRIDIKADTAGVPPRKFTISLSNPTGGAVITKGTETITIKN